MGPRFLAEGYTITSIRVDKIMKYPESNAIYALVIGLGYDVFTQGNLEEVIVDAWDAKRL